MKTKQGILIGVGVLVGIVALTVGGLFIRYYLAGPTGAVTAVEQIQSGSHRIAAYNHFFDLCAGVQANEVALDAQYIQLRAMTDNSQKSRVLTNITGLIGHRASLVAEYNANARKDYTEGQFRDSDLPYQLVITWNEGGRTSCGS